MNKKIVDELNKQVTTNEKIYPYYNLIQKTIWLSYGRIKHSIELHLQKCVTEKRTAHQKKVLRGTETHQTPRIHVKFSIYSQIEKKKKEKEKRNRGRQTCLLSLFFPIRGFSPILLHYSNCTFSPLPTGRLWMKTVAESSSNDTMQMGKFGLFPIIDYLVHLFNHLLIRFYIYWTDSHKLEKPGFCPM